MAPCFRTLYRVSTKRLTIESKRKSLMEARRLPLLASWISLVSSPFLSTRLNNCVSTIANEALQQQFNLFVFKTEQEEYRREGIQWEFIDFPDNQDVIDLVDQKRIGILSILTDQCRAPRGTDGSFCDAMYKTCGAMPRFEATNLQRGQKQFAIVHYAGPVTYETNGFVEKNKDEIPRGASKLLKSSSKDFIQLLGMMMDDSAGASVGTGTRILRVPVQPKRNDLRLQVNSRRNSMNFAPVLTRPCHITFAVSSQTNC